MTRIASLRDTQAEEWLKAQRRARVKQTDKLRRIKKDKVYREDCQTLVPSWQASQAHLGSLGISIGEQLLYMVTVY